MDYRIILAILLLFFAIIPIVNFLVIKNEKIIKVIFLILAIIYCILICIGVFFKVNLAQKITITLFENVESVNKSFSFYPFAKTLTDFLINILMFVPLGFLLSPIIKKHTLIKTLLIGLIFSTFIELMQLLLPIVRSPQLSDIILNTLSCLIGGLCFSLLKLFKSLLTRKKSN